MELTLKIKIGKGDIEIVKFDSDEDLLEYLEYLRDFQDTVWILWFQGDIIVSEWMPTIEIIVAEFMRFNIDTFELYAHKSYRGAYEHVLEIIKKRPLL